MSINKKKLQKIITDYLAESVAVEFKDQLATLQKLNPNLSRTFILNSWSGWCDGEEEHPVFGSPLGQDYYLDYLIDGARDRDINNVDDLKALSQYEKENETGLIVEIISKLEICGSEYGGGMRVPYSSDEIKEVNRFLVNDYEAFEKYYDLAYKLAEAVLKPIADMVPRDHWIEIPISK